MGPIGDYIDYLAKRRDPIYATHDMDYYVSRCAWWQSDAVEPFTNQRYGSTGIIRAPTSKEGYRAAWVMTWEFYKGMERDFVRRCIREEVPKPVVLIAPAKPEERAPEQVLRSIFTEAMHNIPEEVRIFLTGECDFDYHDFYLDLSYMNPSFKSVDQVLEILEEVLPKVREKFYPDGREDGSGSGDGPQVGGRHQQALCLVAEMDLAVSDATREKVERLMRFMEEYSAMEGRKLIFFVGGEFEAIKGLKNADSVVEILKA
ncbi:hypothetical protein DL766_001113 [Monosporascus sp. MC13-8B]|uniref:Uncharacterized protein n=1 Tax=Monosporascus cannonballus TaxID=155416 RepID=A0ABY0H7E8_9PEZI|nr:hypothetical protein DL762_004530 [Monosporascus cannonballus]RYO90535.1 hypothetical protein DL763_005300 [Monosporascus cannonballus]RYP38203.1 hypothetical protein DL766_001113 [Monosporascus sp. MC13-8B]